MLVMTNGAAKVRAELSTSRPLVVKAEIPLVLADSSPAGALSTDDLVTDTDRFLKRTDRGSSDARLSVDSCLRMTATPSPVSFCWASSGTRYGCAGGASSDDRPGCTFGECGEPGVLR